MRRVNVNRMLLLLAAGWIAVAMSADGQVLHASGARPSFAVASVRPSEHGNDLSMHDVRADSFMARGMTLREIVLFAYGIVFDHEISGGPAWMGADRFDVEAKPDEAEIAALGKLSNDDRDEQMRLRVQSLLAERFQLKVSFAKKELPVYDLVVAKGGLKCAKIESVNPFAKAPPPRFGGSALPPPPPPPGYTPPAPDEARALMPTMHMRTQYWPFWLVVTALGHEPELGGRTVVDKTGLEGTYDCEATWLRAGAEGAGPSFFTAIQEQMGLKLEPSKGMVETVVIDHVERPSAN
jgi:uncharacterized protein (TIGR03435 family)